MLILCSFFICCKITNLMYLHKCTGMFGKAGGWLENSFCPRELTVYPRILPDFSRCLKFVAENRTGNEKDSHLIHRSIDARHRALRTES